MCFFASQICRRFDLESSMKDLRHILYSISIWFILNSTMCVYVLDILPGDSRDKLGRSRFHCLTPNNHVHGGFPDWYLQYDKYGAKKVSQGLTSVTYGSYKIVPFKQIRNDWGFLANNLSNAAKQCVCSFLWGNSLG